MATKKAGGTAKNISYQNPKYLGIKVAAGEVARPGSVIVRQRGTRYFPGNNVGQGHDHTLFAVAEGAVRFETKRRRHFDGRISKGKFVHVDPIERKNTPRS